MEAVMAVRIEKAKLTNAQDIETLADEQYKFDDRTQAERFANVHAMRKKGQCRAAARSEANSFIRERILKAIDLEKTAYHQAALRALSQAMHTVQDSASPAHAGFNEAWEDSWLPLWDYFNHIPHYSTENFMPPAGGVADTLTQNIWKYFKGQLPLPDNFFTYDYDLKYGRAWTLPIDESCKTTR